MCPIDLLREVDHRVQESGEPLHPWVLLGVVEGVTPLFGKLGGPGMIDKVLPLSQVHEAERLMEERALFGKIVLTP